MFIFVSFFCRHQTVKTGDGGFCQCSKENANQDSDHPLFDSHRKQLMMALKTPYR